MPCAHDNAATGHKLTTTTLSLLLLALWAVTHRFHSLTRDGELYAFQAMARINPSLRADVYLSNASQDDFTFFSPLYAQLIKVIGLQNAEVTLFVICTSLFFVSAWYLSKLLTNSFMAWLNVGLLMVIAGYYGGSTIFRYAEPYLTARSMAEGLAVTALAFHFARRRWIAIAIGAATMAVHPLMALPVLFLLISLSIPLRFAISLAVTAAVLAFALSGAASTSSTAASAMVIMDPLWLEVVRERSQFLFLKYWTTSDWEIAAQPFVCLTLTALAFSDARLRSLCARAMLVGATGLALAYAATASAPLAVLLQGQPWRWMWVTSFMSVLLLLPTAWKIWHEKAAGPLCATLLVLGWTCPAVDGLLCADAALLLWLIRDRLSAPTNQYLKWTAYLIGFLTMAWVISSGWGIARGPVPFTAGEPTTIVRFREIFGLGVPVILMLGVMVFCMDRSRSPTVLAIICAASLVALSFTLKGSLVQAGPIGTATENDEFADWRAVIPPTETVLILPTGKSAAFAWFALERPSYMSVDQSAGVVFSRATALEIRRRSEVLRKLEEPNWQILSHIMRKRTSAARSAAEPTVSTQLTESTLTEVCRDERLGFVIAQENLGFDPLRHRYRGSWKDWNLYDCRKVRAAAPSA